jgi:hypothetical protein
MTSRCCAVVLLLGACSEPDLPVSFYHWKANAEYGHRIEQAIKQANSSSVYLHLFDIEVKEESSITNDGVFPSYVIQNIDDGFKVNHTCCIHYQGGI